MLPILDAALQDVTVRTTPYDLGAARWHRTGETLTDEDAARLAEHDAILLGAIGDPSVPSGVLERGILLPLRFALDHYVNLRPAKLYPGVTSPLAEHVTSKGLDFVVVREGTEGPYVGNGGALRVGTPLDRLVRLPHPVLPPLTGARPDEHAVGVRPGLRAVRGQVHRGREQRDAEACHREADKLADRQRWRDRRLMALSRHKRKAAADIGN